MRTAKLFAFIRGAAAIGIAVNPVVLDRAKHGPRAIWRRHVRGQVVGFTDDEDRALKTALLAVLYRALTKAATTRLITQLSAISESCISSFPTGSTTARSFVSWQLPTVDLAR